MNDLFATGLGFAAPWALLPLVATPLLFFLLRATPPAPKRAELPSAALLLGLSAEDRTPRRTPLWLVLFRIAIAALFCLGLARPHFSPRIAADAGGDLLIVADDGFGSAALLDRFRTHALAAAAETRARGGRVYALFTAPRLSPRDPSEALSPDRLRALFAAARAAPWAPDRLSALAQLRRAAIRPARILWLADGLDYGDKAFADGLAAIAPTVIRQPDHSETLFATGLAQQPNGQILALARAERGPLLHAPVTIEGLDGAVLAASEAQFAAGGVRAAIRLPLASPGAKPVLARAGGRGAAGVALFADSGARPRIGLVAPSGEAKPLLSDAFYLERALTPYAEISRGKVDDLLKARLNALLLTDEGGLAPAEAAAISSFVEKGGVLIRFAGPRLAQSNDTLLPVALRAGDRSLGGALAWERAQAIAPFAESSPFYGIAAPADAKIRRQVLAQPGPELEDRVWARTADGAPIVTGAARGAGLIVLFHIGASPQWSDLPLSGAFVEMLRKIIALRETPRAGAAEAARNERAGADNAPVFPLLYALDGDGRLTRAGEDPPAFRASAFASLVPGPNSPPGLYGAKGRVVALNALHGAPPHVLVAPPHLTRQRLSAAPSRRDFGGPLLALALVLAGLDALVALWLAGGRQIVGAAAATKRRPIGGGAALALAFGLGAAAIVGQALIGPPPAFAQYAGDPQFDRLPPSVAMRLAYVRTGDPELDSISRAGLLGLTRALYYRSAIEPASPDGVDLEHTDLSVYPLIYWPIAERVTPLSPLAAQKLNAFMRQGGTLLIDTRDGGSGLNAGRKAELGPILAGLEIPPLEPLPAKHVLNRAFFLLKETPGRFASPLWVEAQTDNGAPGQTHDGVTPIVIGGGDWASAWAIDDRGRYRFPTENGEAGREAAFRFGINLVCYVLTGNYKDDQIHLPALIERLKR